MHKQSLADMRLRTAEIALVQARRRRAALLLIPRAYTRDAVVAQLRVMAEVEDQERRATAERARLVRSRYLPDTAA